MGIYLINDTIPPFNMGLVTLSDTIRNCPIKNYIIWLPCDIIYNIDTGWSIYTWNNYYHNLIEPTNQPEQTTREVG